MKGPVFQPPPGPKPIFPDFTIAAGKSAAMESPSKYLMSLTRGKVIVRALPGPNAMTYYLYVPRRPRSDQHPLVVVHGISRNAREHAEEFARLAEPSGRVIVAPLFPVEKFARYQKVTGGRCRADQALLDVLQDVHGLTGLPEGQFDLFGFSGGSQFAHRFAMLHPHRVASLALASAGWYTFPTDDEPFPYGMAASSRTGRELYQNLRQFLCIPMLVSVGELDVARDESLRQKQRVDTQQGRTRVERALRWARAIRQTGQRLGIAVNLTFELLPQCDHAFRSCVDGGELVERVGRWLTPQAPPEEV